MDLSLVYQILSLGVTGFAFIMLFMGYRLILKYPGKENQGNIRFFLVISLVFFLIGAVINLIEDRRPKELSICVIPSSVSATDVMPVIVNTTENKPLEVAQGGITRTQVSKNTALIMNFTALEKRIADLERTISGYQYAQSATGAVGVAHD